MKKECCDVVNLAMENFSPMNLGELAHARKRERSMVQKCGLCFVV